MNFATLQGLTIPEGVVTQIADEQGNVLWSAAKPEPIVLEVAKQTLTTYAGETSYADESFVLLDIYPRTANSTVNVTYGGLTKTLTFSGTNAQQVYFGTFNGVSDSTETPASGTLTIEGGYSSFACGAYQSSSKTISKGYCSCITAVNEWGIVEQIPAYAFHKCSNLALTSLPSGITSIGNDAFYNCSNLALTSLPSGITSIGNRAFENCSNLALTSLPSGITSIGNAAFYNCYGIRIQVFPEGLLSIDDMAFYMTHANLTAMYGLIIVLPSTLQSIGYAAFLTAEKVDGSRVEYLAGVNILATTPPTLTYGDYGVFIVAGNSVSTFKITVPKGCGEAYKTAEGWSNYANYIVEAS